jgi:hypothetical protein
VLSYSGRRSSSATVRTQAERALASRNEAFGRSSGAVLSLCVTIFERRVYGCWDRSPLQGVLARPGASHRDHVPLVVPVPHITSMHVAQNFPELLREIALQRSPISKRRGGSSDHPRGVPRCCRWLLRRCDLRRSPEDLRPTVAGFDRALPG